jgi:YesN/AraC family two-component response regulator
MSLRLIRILLVDDDEAIRSMMDEVLQEEGCIVTTAANVPDALKLITSNVYDVLLTDLHMPDLGDGLTVVSAMRHANPKAVTMILSAFPEMDAASRAIMLQADQVLVKPMDVVALVRTIKERLATGAPPARVIETVATILERTANSTIKDWFEHIQGDEKVMAVPLTYKQRTGHLPQVLRDLVLRLRSSQPIGSKELVSAAAAEHGVTRRRQGYSSAMMVEESRMLQVSVFHTLQKNLARIDFSILLTEVMTIADEIDSQLSQAMTSYVTESATNALLA